MATWEGVVPCRRRQWFTMWNRQSSLRNLQLDRRSVVKWRQASPRKCPNDVGEICIERRRGGGNSKSSESSVWQSLLYNSGASAEASHLPLRIMQQGVWILCLIDGWRYYWLVNWLCGPSYGRLLVLSSGLDYQALVFGFTREIYSFNDPLNARSPCAREQHSNHIVAVSRVTIHQPAHVHNAVQHKSKRASTSLPDRRHS